MGTRPTIRILTTGGTIDKVYFDRSSDYQVGDPQIGNVLERSDVGFEYSVETLFRKDSLDLTDDDRRTIRETIASDAEHDRFIVTHGTDTMVDTARALRGLDGRVIVLTGSLEPARFRESGALFNIGCAVAAVQALVPGVYIVMNGRIFDAERVRKNVAARRFEDLPD